MNRELGALPALAPLLEDIDPSTDWSGLPAPDRDWLLYTHSRESATIRAIRIAESRGLTRLRMLWDAVVPSRTALSAQDLTAQTATPRRLLSARLRRLRHGAAAVPTVWRDFSDYRRRRHRGGTRA